jgi:hypothetical protein
MGMIKTSHAFGKISASRINGHLSREKSASPFTPLAIPDLERFSRSAREKNTENERSFCVVP